MQVAPRRPASLRWLAVGGPLVAAALLLLLIVRANPAAHFGTAEPLDAVAVERVTLDRGVIRLHLRNDGRSPVTIAQVSVNDAFWHYTSSPRTLGRLDTATVTIRYPWERGQPLHLAVLTSSGVTVEHDIAAAALTPAVGANTLADYGLLGLVIGVAPVALGLLWLPALRRARPGWLRFFLALTVGLLVFLLAETVKEGLEQASRAPASLRGVELFVVAFLVVGAAMAWLSRVLGRGSGTVTAGLGLAYLVAIGIGLHNLGEGLAVSSAVATGEVALGTSLIVGFAVHNTTEGLAIASPLGASTAFPPLRHLVALALVAGSPAILGAWAGAFVVTPAGAALAFGVAAGAIAQVVWAVGRTLLPREPGMVNPVAGGFVTGVVLMYLTALLTA